MTPANKSRLYAAIKDARQLVVFTSVSFGAMEKYLREYNWKLAKNEPLDPEEVARVARLIKEGTQDTLRSLGALHSIMTTCFPTEAQAKGSQTAALEADKRRTAGPDQSAKGSPKG